MIVWLARVEISEDYQNFSMDSHNHSYTRSSCGLLTLRLLGRCACFLVRFILKTKIRLFHGTVSFTVFCVYFSWKLTADCKPKMLFCEMSDDVRSGRLNSSRSLTDAEAISAVVALRFDRNPEVRRHCPAAGPMCRGDVLFTIHSRREPLIRRARRNIAALNCDHIHVRTSCC